jgi:hypothetical protein
VVKDYFATVFPDGIPPLIPDDSSLFIKVDAVNELSFQETL